MNYNLLKIIVGDTLKKALKENSPPEKTRKRLHTDENKENLENKHDRYNKRHLPRFDDKKSASRCYICKNKTTHAYCKDCDVHLCLLQARNCFLQYHLGLNIVSK